MFRLLGLAGAFAALVLFAAPASAATPYYCFCNGVKKRFVGGTYYCGRRTPRCTSAEYEVFNIKACKANKCTPPKTY